MALGNPLSVPYPAAMLKIRDLSLLKSNWNGHGAVPLSPDSRRAAEDFLSLVWQHFGGSVAEPTVVAATSDGGVALEWIVREGSSTKGIELVFLAKGNEFSVRDRDRGRLEDGGENIEVRQLLTNVIKPHVAGHFILAK